MLTGKAGKKTNLIFIFADQLGALSIGCYGHPQVRTPNLDRFASEAVMFENAYTVAPLCTPFRGALFTGRYPVQTGILKNSQGIPETKVTLADCFNEAGYLTSYVGKWHLTESHLEVWVPEDKRGGFKDFTGWDCGHSRHIDQLYFERGSEELLTMPGHETDALTDIACRRLDEYSANGQPFCMFLSYQAPHPYCDPPAEYLEMYRDSDIAYRPTVDHSAVFRGYGFDSEPLEVKEWTERYFGEITHLDNSIGRLLGYVSELGLDENTIIVFTSDHGDMGGCHGLFEKGVSFEEAIRIPLFVRTPETEHGKKTDVLFSSIDFFPTLLGLCGIEQRTCAEGFDYSSLILGKKPGHQRKEVIIQLEKWACLISGDEKLTLNSKGTEPLMFFRLSSDPFEQYNLVDNSEEQNLIRDYMALYRRKLEKLGVID